MAETDVPSGLEVQRWEDKYFTEYLNQNWFKKFMGTGSNAMICVKEDLTTKPGGSITVQLNNRLKGTAKNQDETLEGNEENLRMRSQQISIREYAHAVKWKVYDNQLTAIQLRKAHKEALMDWNMELDRDLIIEAMGTINGTAYSSASEAQKDAWLADNADRVLFGAAKSNNSSNDHSASLANVDNTADKLTSSALSLMKRMAKTADPKIKPFRPRNGVSGSDAYVVFAPSLCMRDLRADSSFEQANRDARERGLKNPLFSDADYVIDNLYIYEIEDISVLSGVGASSIDVAPVYMMGQQALAQVWAKRPTTALEDFDYGRKKGIAIKEWMKIEKLQFGTGTDDTDDPKDHGVLTGYFAAVADS
jgi:N4-gp56 family major capsid protein